MHRINVLNIYCNFSQRFFHMFRLFYRFAGTADSQPIRTDMTGQTKGKFITHNIHSRKAFFNLSHPFCRYFISAAGSRHQIYISCLVFFTEISFQFMFHRIDHDLACFLHTTAFLISIKCSCTEMHDWFNIQDICCQGCH